jgi:hypothetical protein
MTCIEMTRNTIFSGIASAPVDRLPALDEAIAAHKEAVSAFGAEENADDKHEDRLERVEGEALERVVLMPTANYLELFEKLRYLVTHMRDLTNSKPQLNHEWESIAVAVDQFFNPSDYADRANPASAERRMSKELLGLEEEICDTVNLATIVESMFDDFWRGWSQLADTSLLKMSDREMQAFGFAVAKLGVASSTLRHKFYGDR